jgi:hypothetical protein
VSARHARETESIPRAMSALSAVGFKSLRIETPWNFHEASRKRVPRSMLSTTCRGLDDPFSRAERFNGDERSVLGHGIGWKSMT